MKENWFLKAKHQSKKAELCDKNDIKTISSYYQGSKISEYCLIDIKKLKFKN